MHHSRKFINSSSPFLRYVVKKLKQLPVLTDLVVMGTKGSDLTASERAIVHSKIKQFWSYEKAETNYVR